MGNNDIARATYGASSQRLQTLANKALERSGTAPWCDPLRIALGLGRPVRAVTRSEERAVLEGECIRYLWVPDQQETDLNVFTGCGLVVLEDAGFARPSPADVVLVAGYLALPDPSLSPELELALQTHAPPWFLREHQKRRRWDRWSASGIFAAVAGRTENVR